MRAKGLILVLCAMVALSGCSIHKSNPARPTSTVVPGDGLVTIEVMVRSIESTFPYDCARSRESETGTMWYCFPIDAHQSAHYWMYLTSSDHVHLNRLTVVGAPAAGETSGAANHIQAEIHRMALALLPFSYEGPEIRDATTWFATQAKETSAGKAFGSIWISWKKASDGTSNLTMSSGNEPAAEELQFHTFDRPQLDTWAPRVNMGCKAETMYHYLETISCQPDSGEKVTLQFDAIKIGDDHLAMGRVMWYPAEGVNKPAEILDAIVAKLGNEHDGRRARDWLLGHADTTYVQWLAVMNAQLSYEPSYISGQLARVVLLPAAF
jgi:hypothetical protein